MAVVSLCTLGLCIVRYPHSLFFYNVRNPMKISALLPKRALRLISIKIFFQVSMSYFFLLPTKRTVQLIVKQAHRRG
jgi:hypothetical protein